MVDKRTMELAGEDINRLCQNLARAGMGQREINSALLNQAAFNMANGDDRDEAARVFRTIADAIEQGEFDHATASITDPDPEPPSVH